MKSTNDQLKNRGYLTDQEFAEKCYSSENIDLLLQSSKPYERTAAVKLIKQTGETEWIHVLCDKLVTEKKLYVKIEICDCLASFGVDAVPFLLPLLGKIGSNQHKRAANVDLNKQPFPLPRDIAARILIRIGPVVFRQLEPILVSGEFCQKLEAVDVVGHVTWNHFDFSMEKTLTDIYRSTTEELMTWKLLRAFQSFKSESITNILKSVIEKSDNQILVKEAARSLQRITARFPQFNPHLNIC